MLNETFCGIFKHCADSLVFNRFVLVVFSFYQEMVAQTIKEVIVGREEYLAQAPGETTNGTETTWGRCNSLDLFMF